MGYELTNGDLASDVLEGLGAQLVAGPISRAVTRFRPDVIVATHPLVQAPAAGVHEDRHVPVLTVVTDLVTVHKVWFSDTADRFCVASDAVRDRALAAGVPEERVEVVGIPVDTRIRGEERSKAELREALGWRSDMATLLIVGSRRTEGVEPVARVLDHSGLSLQLALVAGDDEELHRDMAKADWHSPAHIYGFVEDMPQMMLAADAIVCKAGGLIVSEALASALPMLLIDVLPGQEEGNARYVVEGGAGQVVESPVEALEAVFHWLDDNARGQEAASRRAEALGRPAAAYDVARLALEMAG
jgi:1,2-diacylglycerol 3-beta-galactosyltransferase